MANSIQKLKGISVALIIGTATILPSCTSSDTEQGEGNMAQNQESKPDSAMTEKTVDSARYAPVDWPDTVHHDGSFDEAVDAKNGEGTEIAEKPSEKTSDAAKKTAESKEVESKKTASTTKVSGEKVASKTPETKSSKTATTKTVSNKATSTTETALTKKLNSMMALKVKVGEKLDCMRISPMKRTDLMKTKRLHDKFLGILPSMLIWVRFEDNKLSKIMKTDPDNLAKINGMSDGWRGSYESIDKQADAILEKYKEEDFYGKCMGK